jgi:hypothetical protein
VHLVQWLFVVIAAVSFVGCAPVGTTHFRGPVWTTDGMYLARGRAGALFLTPSSLDVSRYRGVMLEEIQISTKHRSRALKPAEEERLRGYFTRRLEDVFGRHGWAIVETPGEDVLLARLAVRDLELRRPRRFHFGTVVKNPSRDKINIVLELRDAVENDRRLLYGDRCRLPFGVYAGSESIPIRRVEDAFYYFSIDFRRRLDQVQHGRFPPPPRPS